MDLKLKAIKDLFAKHNINPKDLLSEEKLAEAKLETGEVIVTEGEWAVGVVAMLQTEEGTMNLPEGAEKAIRNIDVNYISYNPEPFNVEEAVIGSFSWTKATEGFDYWLDVHNQLRTKKPDLSTALEGLEKSLKELQQAMNEVRQAITN